MSKEPSGATEVSVVEPGSADDPFTGTPGPAATGTPEEPASQPDGTEGLTPEEDVSLEAELEEALEAKIQERIRAVQSGWDKRNAALSGEIKELRASLKEAQRTSQAANLTDDEREALKDRWSLEDERELVKTQKSAVDEYRKSVEMLRLVTQFEKYGVTQGMLEACETPEEMELLAERTRADFLEKGGKPGTQKKPPAGAVAQTDLGGAPGAPAPEKLSLEQGVQGMAANVKSLFGKPGNVV